MTWRLSERLNFALACSDYHVGLTFGKLSLDDSQPAWADAPEWARSSAILGARFTLEHPEAGPAASHESWLEEKRNTGWAYGPVKDPDKKQHPCFVPYGDQPLDQRVKDSLFQAVVRGMAPLLA